MTNTAEIDGHVAESLDVSNFANLKDGGLRATNEGQLKSASKQAVHAQIEQIQKYADATPDGELVQPNKELLSLGADVETWFAGPGNFSITSAYGWALGGGVMFPGKAPLGFLYGGKGESWKAWATGTCVMLGSFVVDPMKVCLSKDFHDEESPIGVVRKGFCNFTSSGGGAGISETNISFYSKGGAFWGSLSGSGALIGGYSLEGELELVWQGF